MAEVSRRTGSYDGGIVRRKGKQRARQLLHAEDTVEASAEDLTYITPLGAAPEDDVGPEVLLSLRDKAPGVELSSDRLSASSSKGFRSVRATHGFHEGTHYCEVTLSHMGETGHCRVGWSSKAAQIAAPVGYDEHGYCYRDVDGSRVHQAAREPYGQPFKEGDVLGLFLHLPPGGRALDTAAGAQLARYKGALYEVQQEQQEPKQLPGSLVAFTLNGVLQGVAFRDVLEGTYYPTASLFTLPQQPTPAQVTFNFGPGFKFPPPSVEGCPAAEPVSVLPERRAAAAEAAEAALLAAAVPAAMALTAAGSDAAAAGSDAAAAGSDAAAAADGQEAAAAANGGGGSSNGDAPAPATAAAAEEAPVPAAAAAAAGAAEEPPADPMVIEAANGEAAG